jgi:hypothetical protein
LLKFKREFSYGQLETQKIDDDEPDWIRDHYIKKAEEKAIQKLEDLKERRRKKNEKLEKIRKGDSSTRHGQHSKGGGESKSTQVREL